MRLAKTICVYLGKALLLAVPGCSLVAQLPPVNNPQDPAPNKMAAATTSTGVRQLIHIPKLERAPVLEDFTNLEPANAFALSMGHVDGFRQRTPTDGAAASQRTDGYVGYDNSNVYVVFLCHDDHPNLIRTQLTKRETADTDDTVTVIFDTYQDQRRGYVFGSNPIGIQQEGLYSEDSGVDLSWDTVWNTSGKRTDNGYMVIMSIPFRSLRFSHDDLQKWGIVLHRNIPRNNEDDYWPYIAAKINGRLNQEAWMNGLDHISPGRNIELNPYGIWRADRSLNNIDTPAHFEGEQLGGRVGADAKFVIKDSLVLDLTVKPDFSQVESDEPQITVNQRFPVFFPEKRPFFLENSNYFNTPGYTLLYTRNIVDPEYGARLTGKLGKWSMGFLFANDKSPGEVVANTDPEFGKKAQFYVARVAYDVFNQSTIGVMYTDREFDGSWNRVGGVDGSFKWRKNYFASFQVLESSTRDLQGNYFAGPAMQLYAGYSSQKFQANSLYQDNSNGLDTTQVGFFSRPDYRRFSNFIDYYWRPKNSLIVAFGPNFFEGTNWDHEGVRLDYQINPGWHFEFKHSTFLNFSYNAARSALRPKDYSTLNDVQDYANGGRSIYFETNYFKKLNFWVQGVWGDTPNVIPASGPPTQGFERLYNANLTVKPLTQLQITTTYLADWWEDAVLRNHTLYNLHVVRTKWNYQLSKEMSVRFIGQYNTTQSHPELVALDPSKNFNYDFLFTYLIHPGTALYVGYNTDLSTLDPALVNGPNGLVQRPTQFINDGRQVFVKLSYLFRF
jgi:hypothetical protein